MKGTDISAAKHAYRTKNQGDFPKTFPVTFEQLWDLKYGENPNQQAALYALAQVANRNTAIAADLLKVRDVRVDGEGKGGLSLNNMMDITRAADTLKFFTEPTALIMKHTMVSGFATQGNTTNRTLLQLFRLARDADRRSNFGGTFATNMPLDMETAQAFYEAKPFFVDVCVAPDYEEGVVEFIMSQSKNIRLAKFSNIDKLPKFVGDDTHGLVDMKIMPGGYVGVQDVFLTAIKTANDLILHPQVEKKGEVQTVQTAPTQEQLQDLLTAWYLNIAGARSNGVVAVRDGISVSMGAGQVERVGAVEQMIVKGMQKAMDREQVHYDPLLGITGWKNLKDNPLKGACVSSDAFFPFRDSVDRLASVGVAAIVQPFGSENDIVVIAAANEHKIAMPATLERCFGHF